MEVQEILKWKLKFETYFKGLLKSIPLRNLPTHYDNLEPKVR